MNTHVVFGEDTFNRVVTAVQRVRERLECATRTLERAGVPYAVVGDNAVAAWIASVDESAVRYTQKVELLVRTCDFVRVKNALEVAGYVHRTVAGVNLFADGGTVRDWHSVRIVLAGEKVRLVDFAPAPDVDESERVGAMQVLSLGPLVHMQLSMFRTNECVNLRDLIDVGLVDQSWTGRLPYELAARLQELLDDPDG